MDTTEFAGDREERREREMDALARLAVMTATADGGVGEFHEWLARDARAGQRSGERRATEARAERFARRMQALVLATRLGVAAAREDPVVHIAREDGVDAPLSLPRE